MKFLTGIECMFVNGGCYCVCRHALYETPYDGGSLGMVENVLVCAEKCKEKVSKLYPGKWEVASCDGEQSYMGVKLGNINSIEAMKLFQNLGQKRR